MTENGDEQGLSWRNRLDRWLGRGTTPESHEHAGGVGGGLPTAYAVGDIHGRLDLLLRIEDLIRRDIAIQGQSGTVLVYLGDYIDRGKDSRGVIEHLLNRPPLAETEIFLRGNHEQVMLDSLETAATIESWAQFGGLETLVSYGLRPKLPLTAESCEVLREKLADALPPSHLAFLRATRPSYETRSHFFAHAGVNPQVPLAQQRPADLMWIRDEFLASSRRFGKRVVHGHTPVPAPEVLPNRINVDTGAYMTGKLSCAVVSEGRCRILSTA